MKRPGPPCQARWKCRAMENVENQPAVSHVSHGPLEIAKGAISTFPPRRRRFPLLGNPNQGLRRNLWVKPAGWVAIVWSMTMRPREDRACGPAIRTATKSACSAPSSVGNPKTPMTTDPKGPTSHRCREAAENQKQTGSGKKIRVADFASRRTCALSMGWRTVRRSSPVDRPTNSPDEAKTKAQRLAPYGHSHHTTKGGSTRGRGPTQSSILQAHVWTEKCWLEKNLPEPSPAGYNTICSGSASYGRF